MKRSAMLWLTAFLVTAATAMYQRMTGPTYPISGSALLNGQKITYKLHRSHGGDTGHTVSIATDDTAVTGVIAWKRYKTDDAWTSATMTRESGALTAVLPLQPPAGKLLYQISLQKAGERISIPSTEPVIIRFKGEVPSLILILHVIAMFGGMLLSTRAGLEFLSRAPRYRLYALWTIGFLFAGGLILGPVVQKYAFDAYWTGWPFGTDLTDNKTIVAFLGWLAVALMLPRSTKPKHLMITAAVILLAVYLIPHSLMGSELDYSKLPK